MKPSRLQQLMRLFAVIGGLAVPAWMGTPQAGAQDDHTLTLFEPVQGAINDSTPVEDWTFEAKANQVVSLIVVTTSGDLDPVLELIGPDGSSIGQNDDLDSLVRDAGLEAIRLPATGTYTARVTRYQGADGTTSGRYDLTLSSGFARLSRLETFEGQESPWVTIENQAVSLAGGKLRLRATRPGTTVFAVPTDAEPLDDLYVQADVRLFGNTSYAEAGFVFRVQGVAPLMQSYRFKVNSEGRWTLLFQNSSGEFVVRSWSENQLLAGKHQWTLAVLARDSTLSFYADGELLGTVTDDRLITPGMVGVLAATRADQSDEADVLFDNLLITTRLGTTYRGLPLTLNGWGSLDPAAITSEVAASGQITPAPFRDLYLTQKQLSTLEPGSLFELIGSEQAVYSDFLLGATINIATTGQSVGCGVVFRWQDERNFSLAYVDTDGGFGVVQASDAALTTNVYDLTEMVALEGGANTLLVVAEHDRGALYVNGALVTQETLIPGAGRAGLALLNYEDAGTDCFFTGIWVWPLDAE